MKKRPTLALALLVALLLPATLVSASGFAIIEQSVSGLGTSFASGAAHAEDPSALYFNPATMTQLEGQKITAGAHMIFPSAKFTAIAASNALGGSLGTNNGGDGGQTAFVPNFYYTNKLNDKLTIGLGINTPFGLVTEYDKTWVGRYHAVKSDVMTVNINPAVAYQVNDKLSLGFGLNAQYIKTNLTSMVDFGLKAYASTGAAAQAAATAAANATDPTTAAALASQAANLAAQAQAIKDNGVISNPNADVYSELDADDWSYGFNLGILYKVTDKTQVGLAYRSQVQHNLKGDASFSLQNSNYLTATGLLAAAQATFVDQGVSGDIDLPATASLSAFHQLTDSLAIMADVSWTQWSSFEKLVMNFDGTLSDSPSITTENWNDSWRYAIGAELQINPVLLLRSGVAFDETPISDEFRTPRIPGEDRLWLSLGAGYKLSKSLNLDAAYAHLFVADSKMIKSAENTEDQGRGTVQGEFENSVDIASVQLTYSF